MKLVVVGGVAAGMSTAARARRLDESAEIVVFEKAHHVSFANCGLPYHIGDVITDRSRLLLQTPESLRESLNLDVRTSTEVIAIDPKKKSVKVRELETGREYTESYEKLALCMGAEAIRPSLPGIDSPSVHVLRRIGDMDDIRLDVDQALTVAKNAKEKPVAIVVGGGYIGVEMAENLIHRGMTVHLIEMSDQLLPPLDREMSVPVQQHMESRGVVLHLGSAVAAFSQSGEKVTAELKTGQFIEAHVVILSAGVRPMVALAKEAGIELGEHGGIKVDTHMRTSDEHIFAAGDAVETPHHILKGSFLTPLAGPANREGRVAAENIMGRSTEYKTTQGTSIVKIFDMVAGGTGATERQLKKEGTPFEAIHIHPSGHAGYYPGTAMMHLKLIFAPGTGRILGAQVAGYDGVDKRIDVLATAVRANQTVYDLEDYELAYAPPFGSAKDPINMAGFVASNVLRGDFRLWKAEEYPSNTEGSMIVDVRTEEEFAIWHIPGAVNVPLAEIRTKAEEWPKNSKIRLYCAVGFRSYLAHRALVQRGFTDVETLSGGTTTFRFWHELEPQSSAPLAAIENYAELESEFVTMPKATGQSISLDCTGLACPGPILKMSEKMTSLSIGDQLDVTVSDPGFLHDAPAWAKRNGHQLLDIQPEGAGYRALIRKGGAGQLATKTSTIQVNETRPKTNFVVFSGDLDKLIAAFIIANGALAMGEEVSMFFTFWGLNALKTKNSPKRHKKLLDKLFGVMMPKGATELTLSQMNMMGMGTSMIKRVMKTNGVASLPELMKTAIDGGAKIVGCTMTMDLLGISQTDLMPGIEFGGVATFLGEAAESHNTLFI